MLLKNLAVTAAPKIDVYNLGNTNFVLSFKGGSSVSIVSDVASRIVGQEAAFLTHLSDKKFYLDSDNYKAKSIEDVLKGNEKSGM